jgi:hypothetical protein
MKTFCKQRPGEHEVTTWIQMVNTVHPLQAEKLFLAHFFLFQLNAHIIKEYIFITNYLQHVSVFVTPSSERPLSYLLKNYIISAILL